MKRNLALTAIAIMSFVVLVRAQGLGTISGTVTDLTGAVVPAVNVTVTEVGTGRSRSASTDASGGYVVPSLRPADYTLTIEAPGFRKFVQRGIVLLADQSLTVNVRLELGAPDMTMTVESAATQVNTTTSTLSQVIEQSRVVDLPLNGRNAAELTLLVAGTVSIASATSPTATSAGGALQGSTKTYPGAVAISTNGSRQNQVSYLLDGGNNVDEYTNVNQPFPFPDALQEFSVQTSNYSAEYGQNAGGVVNIITKSGTNNIHGSVFEFGRNAVFNARNFFASDRDQLKRNQFGGTIGGPVVLPGYNGRDRTFFFAGYQGTRLRNIQGGLSGDVPTQSAINNAPSIDPAVRRLLSFLPKSNAITPTGTDTVFFTRPDRQNFDEVVGKVDHSLGRDDRLTFRYYYARFHKDPIFDPSNILTYADGSTIPSQNFLIHETHTFSPNLLNDFRFSYSREAARRGPADNVPSVRDLGVNIPFQPKKNAIQSIEVTGVFSFGDNPDARFTRNNFTWSDDLSWVRGRHNLRFGGVVERSQVDLDNLFRQPGLFTFANLADFLAGTLRQFRQGFGEFKNNRNIFPGLYIQDDFHVSRRLTLNFGLRYEPSLPWREIRGRVGQFRMDDFLAGRRSTQFINAPPGLFFPGDPGVPKNGTLASLNIFSPRLGFAYDVFGDGKTSLRGGGGIFYDARQPGIINNRFVNVTPFSPQLVLTPPPGPFSDPLSSGQVASPFPAPFPPPSTAPFPTPVEVVTYDPSTKSLAPTLYNWNLTIEREVYPGWLVRGAYVGSQGRHIRETVQLNPASPGSGGPAPPFLPLDPRRRLNVIAGQALFSGIFMSASDVNSSYNALQLSVERRFSRGLTILANYTYSKSIDTLPVGGGVTDIGADNPSTLPWGFPGRSKFDRGLSDFDHKHRFVGSYVWRLPGFTKSSALLRHVLADWTLSGLLTTQTGRPFTLMSGLGSGSDRSQTGLGRDRALLVGNPFGPGACGRSAPCVDFLIADPNGPVQQPPIGTFGNVGKNSLRWLGSFTWDMGFFKDFKVSERWRLQFRAEFFNIFNRVNFRSDDTSVNNTTERNRGTFGTIRAADDPRIGQLALKILF